MDAACRRGEVPKAPPPESLPGLLEGPPTALDPLHRRSGQAILSEPMLPLHIADGCVPDVDFLIQSARLVGCSRCAWLFMLDRVNMHMQYFPDGRITHQGEWELPMERPVGVVIIKLI